MNEASANLDGGTLTLTDSAAARVASIRTQEGNDALMLRITVSGGGCSGFQYGFSLDETVNEDDRVFERAGIRLVVDEMSLGLLDGAEVDFVEDLGGAYFAVKNPNASATCGCGNSFAL